MLTDKIQISWGEKEIEMKNSNDKTKNWKILTKNQAIFCFIIDVGCVVYSVIIKDWIALGICVVALAGLVINLTAKGIK